MDLLNFCNCLLSELAFHAGGQTCSASIVFLQIHSQWQEKGKLVFTCYNCEGNECLGSCMNLSFQHPPQEEGNFVPVIRSVPHQLLSALCTDHMKHGSGWSCSLQGQSYLPLAQCSCNTSLHCVPVPLATSSSSFHCQEAWAAPCSSHLSGEGSFS